MTNSLMGVSLLTMEGIFSFVQVAFFIKDVGYDTTDDISGMLQLCGVLLQSVQGDHAAGSTRGLTFLWVASCSWWGKNYGIPCSKRHTIHNIQGTGGCFFQMCQPSIPYIAKQARLHRIKYIGIKPPSSFRQVYGCYRHQNLGIVLVYLYYDAWVHATVISMV